MLFATLRFAALVAAANAVGADYTLLGNGACRGNGGSTDKVNSRSKTGFASEADCEAACDAADGSGDGLCAGFSYESTGDKICILYGPGMAGACASPNADKMSPDTCLAVGTCSAPADAGSEEECGTCSDASAVKAAACASVAGTWTGGTWTTTGVWEESAADGGSWTDEFFHTDHVHAVSPSTNFVCYDKDVTDHVGKCTSGPDSPAAGSGGDACTTAFATAGTYEKDSCPEDAPDNCIWTSAPSAPAAKPGHPEVTSISGYTYKSGACRYGPSPWTRPAYLSKKNTEFPTFPAGTAPSDLAKMCDDMHKAHESDETLPDCVGFHSGPWMGVFGNGVEAETYTTYTADGWAGWAGDPGTDSLDTTKPNHQYVCFYKQEGGGSDPCFPSSAKVTKADGTAALVSTLKEGDAIVAATADGLLTTDTVSLLSIAKPEGHAPMIALRAGNVTLTLTPEHHLPVGPSCCSELKQAKDVVVGEKVYSVRAGAPPLATTVTAKSTTHGKGLHSPVLTHGGFPIVDGLVTAFDSIEKVTLAKHGLAPLIIACKATGTCDTFRNMFLAGDRKYIEELRRARL